jgi:hypothetical protein
MAVAIAFTAPPANKANPSIVWRAGAGISGIRIALPVGTAACRQVTQSPLSRKPSRFEAKLKQSQPPSGSLTINIDQLSHVSLLSQQTKVYCAYRYRKCPVGLRLLVLPLTGTAAERRRPDFASTQCRNECQA